MELAAAGASAWGAWWLRRHYRRLWMQRMRKYLRDRRALNKPFEWYVWALVLRDPDWDQGEELDFEPIDVGAWQK